MRILSWRWDEVVIVSDGWCRFIKWAKLSPRVPRAMAQWPILLVRDENEARRPWLLNHERIHFAQQRETLVLGLMMMTLVEWLIARLWLRMGSAEAYYWRATEQEAYLKQHNLDYLKTRPLFAVWKYVWEKKRFRVTEVPGEIEFY